MAFYDLELSRLRLSTMLFCFCLAWAESGDKSTADQKPDAFADKESCIFNLAGSLSDCAANVDDVERFNNQKFFPSLQNLLQQNYFRYYKVNMEKPCPLWKEERECSSRECGVQNCDDEVPAGLRSISQQGKSSREVLAPNTSDKDDDDSETCAAKPDQASPKNDDSNKLDPLDKHISPWQEEQFEKWAHHDEMQDSRFCDVDDQDSVEMHYVDLQRNPERYTGYKGTSALRVWKAIYEENCFKPDPKFDKQFLLHPTLTGLCLEKRVFYRLISGLHTSITVSIAAHNYKPAPVGFGKGEWVRNVEMFKNRFMHPMDKKGEGRDRLKNLYFVFLLELRALQKLAPYLQDEIFFTGQKEDDTKTKELVTEVLKLVDEFKWHFDESIMFKDGDALMLTLKEEFRVHFVNISRIMDCVGCDKCRLWGKLQTHGIGTALKVLFSSPRGALVSPASFYRRLKLQRNDLVALLNSMGRFASSILEIEQFFGLLDTNYMTSQKRDEKEKRKKLKTEL